MEKIVNDCGVNEVIEWRRVGLGSFYPIINGKRRIIKPNQRFKAMRSEIPEYMRTGDHPSVVPVHPEDADLNVTIVDPVNAYEIVSTGGGWYDIINTVTGKTVNDKKLRSEEATKLMETLA